MSMAQNGTCSRNINRRAKTSRDVDAWRALETHAANCHQTRNACITWRVLSATRMPSP
jgi:hypothetical protein